MNHRFLPALLAAASLLLTGCLVGSKNPLSTPATSTIDPRLEGIYVQHSENSGEDLNGFHFHYRREKVGTNGQSRTTPWLELLNVAHEKDGGLKVTTCRVLTTHLGGHDYMSVMFLSSTGEKGKSTFYSFARYEVNWSGVIRLWWMNTSAFEEAMKAGQLHGKVQHQKSKDPLTVDAALLTDSTERLAAFVAAGDPNKLFGGQPTVLYRLAR